MASSSLSPPPLSAAAAAAAAAVKPPSLKKKPHTVVTLIHLCRNLDELSQAHSLLIKTGLIHNKHAFGRLLLSLASIPSALPQARKLFDSPECPRNAFVYNTMIRYYSHHGDPHTALLLFSQLLSDPYLKSPDAFTYTFACTACCDSSSLWTLGTQLHARMVKDPAPISAQSWNSLMNFYLKIGEDLWRVRRILRDNNPDVVSWNILLHGYVKSGDLEGATTLFDEMPNRDAVSWTTLLVGYSHAGLLEKARRLFDSMPERTMVSWSAMVSGYARAGLYKEALALFEEMQVAGVEIDKITLTTLLPACAGLGALDQGRWIHTLVDRHGVEADAHLCTALVDMYGKCGRIDLACEVFRLSRDKKVFLWNAMLGAFAMHSRGKEALQLFSEMMSSGVKPDMITFVCVLSACSHSGLVDDGLRIFYNMERDYKVTPSIEHYGCVVDLLGRAGLLDEARMLIETAMPMAADGSTWRALLGACRQHGNVELGEYVGMILLEMEPMDDGNYVLLSNVYAIENRWEDVARLRRMMKNKGVRKTPGFSSIEVNGIAHTFVAGDWSHPHSLEINALLDEMTKQFFVER